MKRCPGCSEFKRLEQFPPNRSQRDGRQSRCTPCHKRYMGAYRATNRDKALAYAKAYYRAHPERFRYDRSKVNQAAKARYTRRWRAAHPDWIILLNRANNAVRRALKTGRLVRASACEWCGATDRKIAGAHHDYSKPLEVTWLCYSCHCRWDTAEPKLPRVS